MFSSLNKDSASSLTAFINTFRENVAAIKALGIEDISGFLLFYIGVRVLDVETKRLYEASIPQSEILTLDSLLDFVSQRCKILENIGTTADKMELGVKTTGKKSKDGSSGKSSLTVTSRLNSSKCAYYKNDHPLYRCFSFKQKPMIARRKFVNNNGVCFICLLQGHQSKSCLSTRIYRTSEGKHNTLLHIDKDVPVSPSNAKCSIEKA
jgi:hypothetical protein